MNIPKNDVPGGGALGTEALSGPQIVANLVTDLAVSGSYVLVLFIIIYLNREKYISLYVPRKTYIITFGAVFAINFLASIAALLYPGVVVTLGYKIAIALLMFAIVAAVWRVLPRDIDVDEQRRLRIENAELQQVVSERDLAESRLRDALSDIEKKVDSRTLELSKVNMALEKEIAERRLAQERAAESKRRLDELIMRTNTAIVFIDGEGVVLDCNHALAQMLGRGKIEELLSRNLSQLLGLRGGDTIKHLYRETLRQSTYTQEFDATPPARGQIFIEANCAASMLESQPCVMALFRDVTERKAAETEILQSREALAAALEVARQANATKSDFLAKMNHELRTPLNGIIGLSEILRHKAQQPTLKGSDVSGLTSNIHQSGIHLLSLVDDLLDLSRLDAGNRTLKPVKISVQAEIDAALVTLNPIAEKKQIKIENNCDPKIKWPTDQRSFKQIIINLVNNAVKFSPEESTVKIEVDCSAKLMSVSIRDEGTGIDEKDRQKILTPFGRGERAEAEKIDGVGLGLTIVTELLKLQGGRLLIESEPGRGSTFTAVLPMGNVMPEEALDADVEPPTGLLRSV